MGAFACARRGGDGSIMWLEIEVLITIRCKGECFADEPASLTLRLRSQLLS